MMSLIKRRNSNRFLSIPKPIHCICLALVVCCISSSTLAGEQPDSIQTADRTNVLKIATVSPISHSLISALIQDTAIQVDYLPPKRLPVNRIPSWIKKHRSHKFAQYDALVTISRVRPGLDFYTTLRQSQIRVVPIDISAALVPAGEKVVLNQAKGAFWLNPANALLMAGIARRDLSALWPQHAEKINQNYQQLSLFIRRLSLMFDEQLFASGAEAVVVNRTQLTDLALALSLPIESAHDVKNSDLSWLELSTTKPGKSPTVTENNWFLDDFSRYSSKSFRDRWQLNIDNLKRASAHLQGDL